MFLHSLSSLIVNFLCLLFGTQGRPRRLKLSINKKQGTQRDFCTWEGPDWVLLAFNPPFSLIFLNPEGNRGQNKEENKVLDREVNYKLGRGTQF